MPSGLSLSDFKAVLFDVDGTLVDSLQMIILGLGDTFERYSGHRPGNEEIRALIGTPLTTQLKLYRESVPSENEMKEMAEFAMDRFDAHEEHESVFPEAVEMLRFCHDRGLRTALVTSKSTRELEGFLKRFIGAPSVDTAVCASDVQHPKPAPDSALLACQLLGVEPHEAVFIGDSVYDMRCAKSAGMPCVAVAYGAATAQVLEAEQPDMLMRTPEELLSWAQTAYLETTCREKGIHRSRTI
jgi:pyrophosphatase PpaX